MRVSQLILLLGVLCVGIATGAYQHQFDYDGDTTESCDIKRNYKSPFVTALYERVDVAAGCQSQERSPDEREVHVVNILQKPNSGMIGSGPTEVTLQLKPRTNTENYKGRLLFILNSEQQVVWKVNSERMSNTTRHLFWISKESRLKKELTIRIKIKKLSMPNTTNELLEWVRARPSAQAITSYTEVQHNAVNTIIAKVGIDPDAPQKCENSAIYSRRPDITALSLHPQQTNACIAQGNQEYQGKDVHIIEVQSSDNAGRPGDTADIVLDITQHAKKPKQRHLILVLKSHREVRWKIRTLYGVKGVVDIITDNKVDSGNVQLQTVSVAAEKLEGLRGADLIEWTRQRYGPAVSYTEATMANKFILIVDAAEQERSPFDNPHKTKTAVITARNVDCQTHRIRVTLKKRTLNTMGVFRQHLSLLDERCVAKDNGSHYILETGLNECGTVRKEVDGQVVYTNVIQVSRLPDDVHLDMEEFSGSGYELAAMDTHIDDEDIGRRHKIDIIQSEFSCQFPKSVFSPMVDPPQYSVGLYIDDTFTEPINSEKVPMRVSKGAKIYLQANVKQAGDVSILVNHCIINMDKSTDKHSLITNRCVSDGTIKRLPAPDSQTYRFGFTFDQYFAEKNRDGEDTKYYVNCQLDVCSKEASNMAYSQCQSPVCGGNSIIPSSEQHLAGILRVAVSKPDPWVSPDGSGSLCKQGSHQTIGLDSTTVVGIAFAAFMIGVLLVAALWFIHSKTASKSSSQRSRFVETSGESTPSSTAPITIHQVNHH